MRDIKDEKVNEQKNKIEMKKITLTIITLAFFASSCNQATQRQAQTANSEIICEKAEETISENDFGNRENPLFGKIYRDITDIPEFSQWTDWGGAVIGDVEIIDGRSGFRFGISLYRDENDNIIVFFVEFVPRDERTSYFKILDTVNIGKLNSNEIVERPICLSVNSVEVCQVIAVFMLKDKTYCEYSGYLRYDFYGNRELVRAWRINMDTGRFEKIDIEVVDCQNEDWGV